MGTGTRIQFSNSDRRQICELHKAHPTLSHEKLTELASRQLKRPGLKRPSITGILKESQKWLNCEHSAASNKVKHRSAKHENLETVLMQWFGQRAKGALLSDKLVSTKALRLAEKLQLADFKASDGWLSKFKKRHGIKLQRPHGESGAADMEGVDIAQTVVAKIIVELGFSTATTGRFNKASRPLHWHFGGFYALLDFMFLCALGRTTTLLPDTMEGQLASVRQNIRSVQEQIVKYEQKLAEAERAGNKGVEEEVRFLRGQLLSLNNQLLSLQEKENILLRSQAPSKPCLQLVHTGLPVFISCCTPFSFAYPVAGHSCYPRLHGNIDSCYTLSAFQPS